MKGVVEVTMQASFAAERVSLQSTGWLANRAFGRLSVRSAGVVHGSGSIWRNAEA